MPSDESLPARMLVGLIGNYTIVAMMLNTFQIGVPEGEKRPFTRS